MKKYFLILLFILLSCSLFSQARYPYVSEGWADSVYMKANTARDSEFLTEDEKKVILYTNLARTDGLLFTKTILKQYLSLKDMKTTNYIRSLYRDLQDVKDLPMLIP